MYRMSKALETAFQVKYQCESAYCVHGMATKARVGLQFGIGCGGTWIRDGK